MTQFASTLYPQTNPTNAILLAVRNGEVTRREVLDAFAPGFDQFAYPYPGSMIHHAATVLRRLSALSG